MGQAAKTKLTPKKKVAANSGNDSDWLPISDMMSGLMIIFLFIAVSYMGKVKQEAEDYFKLQQDLFSEMHKTFKHDLIRWNAEIDEKTLSVRFNEPDILFAKAKSNVNERFKLILQEFIPRYFEIVAREPFRMYIEEIRIEGHTSSTGDPNATLDDNYMYNMKLSQDRARKVLGISLSIIEDESMKAWLRKRVVANGLSFSNPIIHQGQEDLNRSRRVEFRLKLKADSVIDVIRKK